MNKRRLNSQHSREAEINPLFFCKSTTLFPEFPYEKQFTM